MVLNALVLSHQLCELRCYRQLPFLFLVSLCFYCSYQRGIAFNSVVVILLWHQQLAQQYLRSSHCCSVGDNGYGWGHGERKKEGKNYVILPINKGKLFFLYACLFISLYPNINDCHFITNSRTFTFGIFFLI